MTRARAGDEEQPRDLDIAVALKDGTRARLRAIRSDDKERLREAFRNLEPATVYTRFFGYKKSLTDRELERAMTFDPDNLVSLVVTIDQDGEEVIIGNGVYVVGNRSSTGAGEEKSGEVAFVVEEDYQGQGIAGLLMRELTRIARGAGLKRFDADVLRSNRAMLRVFANSGLPMTQSLADGDVRVSLAL